METATPTTSNAALLSECRDLVARLQATVQEQKEFIDSITGASKQLGIVVAGPVEDEVSKKFAQPGEEVLPLWHVVSKGQPMIISSKASVKPGDVVTLLSGMTGTSIFGLLPEELAGQMATVEKVASVEGRYAIIGKAEGVCKMVNLVPNLEEGDEVNVVEGCAVSLHKKADVKSAFQHVQWDDIGGLETAKRTVRRSLELLLEAESKLRSNYKIGAPKGILLEGPPGCGKTMIAKAAATEVVKRYGGRGSDTALLMVNGPEILSPWVGQAEANIRSLFLRARQHYKKHGYRAVLLIDEADALLPRRGSKISSDVESTTVPQFLAEMDGFQGDGPMIFLMTNLADTLDPAVVREGRIDLRVNIPRPNRTEGRQIIDVCLGKHPLGREHDALGCFVHGRLYEPAPHKRISGSLISTLINSAASIAYERDSQTCLEHPSGINFEDIDAALALVP